MADKFIPKGVLEFLQRKKLKPTDHWTDLWHGEHARYFTVARSVYADIVNDVYDEVVKAITNGDTLETFKKNLTPVLQQKGWWGKADDGVQLGSPRRMQTIYDTQMRTSYAAAHWERIQRRKKSRPYLRYVCVLDEKTRAEHRRWHGIILPVDHPFWRTHYPPNGWHCRCIVQQLSLEDIERNGWCISENPEEIYREWENHATGEVKLIPEGIAPGFDYNVGIANLRVKAREQVAEKLKKINPNIAANTINSLVNDDDFADFYKNPQGYFAVGVVDDRIKQALKADVSVCCLSDETLLKNQKHHPDLTIDDYKLMNQVLGEYDILVQDTAKSVVAVKEIADKNYWLAVKVTRAGNEIFTQTFHLTRQNDIKRLLAKGTRLK